MTKTSKVLATTALASLAVVTMLGASASAASLNFVQLNLFNGWKFYASGTRVPTAAVDSDGIVHLRGAMFQQAGSNNAFAFTLPANMRPLKTVYVSVDMVNANTGRLQIEPSGQTFVEATGAQANAQSFTSLEGVIFPTN